MFHSKAKYVVPLALALAVVGQTVRADVVVSPATPNGWASYSTDDSGTIGTGAATTDFVTGPGTPPLGAGSAHIQTGDGTTGGDGSGQWRYTVGGLGIPLQVISELKYSTYYTSIGGDQVPYLTLWIDTNGDNVAEDRIHFEPVYSAAGAGNGNLNPQPAIAPNTWQQWDALDGMWYDDHGIFGVGPGANAVTFAEMRTDLSNFYGGTARVIDDSGQGIGGLRLTSGFSNADDIYNTNIDDFRLGVGGNTTVFDFEPTAAPEPASLALLGIGGAALLRRRRA